MLHNTDSSELQKEQISFDHALKELNRLRTILQVGQNIARNPVQHGSKHAQYETLMATRHKRVKVLSSPT